MRVVVVGLGVQGKKRKLFAGNDYVASIDPCNDEADHKDIKDIPLKNFDAALCCVPDQPKYEIIKFLLENKKHVLVEKPLWVDDSKKINELKILASKHGVVCYTAYNHRFEPNFVEAKKIIESGRLGRLYSCRMFYGNGTARLVKESPWRDIGAGVLPDLSSHLLDTIDFWFSQRDCNFEINSVSCFENLAPDHVVLANNKTVPKIFLEMTLLQWRNHFTCDILAELGSLHLRSLCKWGPATLTERKRLFPSGRPEERSVTIVQDDPTWLLEYQHFKKLCERAVVSDFEKDIWMDQIISNLSAKVAEMKGK